MKTVILFLLIILFSIKTQNIFANTSVFTVDNINIEGVINDNNYREKYVDTAFRKGFEKLTENILQFNMHFKSP